MGEGCVVRISSIGPKVSKTMLRNTLAKAAGTIAYLDFKAGQGTAHVRFGGPGIARAAVGLGEDERVIGGHGVEMCLLQGQEEAAYLKASAAQRSRGAAAAGK